MRRARQEGVGGKSRDHFSFIEDAFDDCFFSFSYF